MSALAFAIAVGTKPTSIMMIPSVGIFFIILASHYKQYKKLLLFFLFGILNFAIFSSYNYILNFIDFSNPMGLQSFIAVNKNTFGLKGAISNFIKHMFMFINFVGFKWGIYLEPWLANIRNQIMMFFHVAHLPDSNYTATGKLLAQPYDPTTAAGILGFLVYIPCVIRSLFSFKPLHKKRFYLSIFGVTFFINIFAISYLMNYSSFDCRYLVAFIIFSSPVLVYSYNAKFKPYKYLVIIFALYSSIFISTNLSQRPVFKITRILKNQNSSQTTLQDTLYTNFPYHFIKKYIINNVPHGAKILVFANKDEEVYLLKSIDFSGYKTDFKLLEKASEIDFNKYDIIVIADNSQLSYFRTIVVPENGISCRYGYQYPGYERILTKCTINKSFFTEKNFLLICTLELNKKDKIYTYYIYKNATNKN